MAAKKGGLGKGLDAIFMENISDTNEGTTLKIDEIEPNRDQPRKEFEPEALRELAESINQHGVIQPLLVRPVFAGGYQIVAGERRWRAARMAGLKEVPVLIREMDDSEFLQIALIENLQREDLTAIEEAQGFQKLMDEHAFTQEQLSKAVGKSRSAVANTLRLLSLPEEIAQMLQKGEISSGHARTLLGFKNKEIMLKAAEIVKAKGMSVRELEELQKKMNASENDEVKKPKKKNQFFTEAELALENSLGRRVKVDGTKKKGTLQIEFYGEDDLKMLLAGLKFEDQVWE